jgi:glyoxylase-like metal-dependent hydrolase (beta-lactamase superfamily II)
MQKSTLEVGTFEVNCTILSWEDKAWIADPGMEAARIAAMLQKRNLTPEAILLTHAHFDHIGAVPELQARWPGLPVYIHPEDEKVLTHPLNNFAPDYPPIAKPQNIKDARSLAGRHGLAVIETPGHTPGGVCYHFPEERLLLSGDTLFAGSIGRTDLPGGDYATLKASLVKLTALPDDTEVIPGHGRFTTIGIEKDSNPFLMMGA